MSHGGGLKTCLGSAPQHGLPKWMQVQTFYLALTPATKTLVNAAAGGALMNKTEDAAYSLLEEMAMNNDHGGSGRNILRK